MTTVLVSQLAALNERSQRVGRCIDGLDRCFAVKCVRYPSIRCSLTRPLRGRMQIGPCSQGDVGDVVNPLLLCGFSVFLDGKMTPPARFCFVSVLFLAHSSRDTFHLPTWPTPVVRCLYFFLSRIGWLEHCHRSWHLGELSTQKGNSAKLLELARASRRGRRMYGTLAVCVPYAHAPYPAAAAAAAARNSSVSCVVNRSGEEAGDG